MSNFLGHPNLQDRRKEIKNNKKSTMGKGTQLSRFQPTSTYTFSSSLYALTISNTFLYIFIGNE